MQIFQHLEKSLESQCLIMVWLSYKMLVYLILSSQSSLELYIVLVNGLNLDLFLFRAGREMLKELVGQLHMLEDTLCKQHYALSVTILMMMQTMQSVYLIQDLIKAGQSLLNNRNKNSKKSV